MKVATYYNKGVDYSATDFANVTDDEIFTVTVNDDGTYSFTSLTGKVIALAGSNNSLNDTGANKFWSLESRDDGTFLVKNTGRNLYLEWYSSKGNWSTYSNANSDLFYITFYVKATGGSETPDEPAECEHEYAEGVCTKCGAKDPNYVAPEIPAECEHEYAEGVCTKCGEKDPTYVPPVEGDHTHTYEPVVTAPTCTTDGFTTHTCACGDSYTDSEVAKLGHVDENLDVECDREGCTSKVAPPAESLVSNFTANCIGSKVSTSAAYYVVGTIVEVLDAKNGIFLIDDGTGEKFYFRLPVNADGVSHANWEIKLVLGDKVKVYGKINKYTTSTAPNGQYWPAMQGPVAELLESHAHDFTAIPATCSKPAYCACGLSSGDPLGCADNDSDNLCDDCGKNVNYTYEYVEIRTDNESGVADTTAGTYTWDGVNFGVQVLKGTGSQLYTTAKDHMRLYKGNQIAILNKNNIVIKSVIVYLTNATQVGYFEKFLTDYTYTTDAEAFTITIEINSAEDIVFTNPSTGSTTQVKGIEIGYEKIDAPAEPEAPECEHKYVDGVCSECGAADPDYKPEEGGEDEVKDTLTIAEAIALGASKDHDTYTEEKYYVTGVITEVYNATYGNMKIKDEAGNILTVYGTYSADGATRYDKLEVKPVAGDTVTVYGIVGQYNGTAQVKNGWIVEHTAHECVMGDASCTAPAACAICGKTEGATLDHNYGEDDKCTACGALNPAHVHEYVDGTCACGAKEVVAGEKVTVSKTIQEVKNALGWTNGNPYNSFSLDDNITASANGTANTGKYYDSGYEWRTYQSESPKITISAAEGKTIVSVKITYAVKNTGVLVLDGTNVASGTVVNVNANSVTFSVGNTGSATNGQVKITAIEVIYQ